jgi:hypothetical protein
MVPAMPGLAEKHEIFKQVVKIWDNTFSISYKQFRNRIYRICDASCHQQFDITLEHIDATKFLQASDDAWVIISDEDDLIHPRFALTLRKHETKSPIIRWNMYRTNYNTNVCHVWDAKCSPTGGYAFKLSQFGKYQELLFYHGRTAKHDAELICDEPLGMIVNQPSGHGSLSKYKGDVVKELKKNIRKFLDSKINIVPEYNRYYQEIIHAYKLLMSSVK